MIRRRAMMAAKEQGGGDSPLYQLFQQVYEAISGYVSYGASGNRVHIKTISNSRGPHVNADSVGTSHDTEKSTFFSLRTGDQAQIVLKDINYTVGTATTRLNVTFKENTSAGATIISTGDQRFSANTSGDVAEMSFTATVTADADINDVYFYLYRAAEFEFDLELYVNGTRYL